MRRAGLIAGLLMIAAIAAAEITGFNVLPGGSSGQLQYNKSGVEFEGVPGTSVSGSAVTFVGVAATTGVFTSTVTALAFSGSGAILTGVVSTAAVTAAVLVETNARVAADQAIGLATNTLRVDYLAGDALLGAATHTLDLARLALESSTGTLQAETAQLRVDTGTLKAEAAQLRVDTGTLQVADIVLTALANSKELAGVSASSITTHNSAADAHAQRFLDVGASTLSVREFAQGKETAGVSASSITTHNSATDAHADRFFAVGASTLSVREFAQGKENAGVAESSVTSHNGNAGAHAAGIAAVGPISYIIGGSSVNLSGGLFGNNGVFSGAVSGGPATFSSMTVPGQIRGKKADHDGATGTYQMRIGEGAGPGLEFGNMTSSPYGAWIQSASESWGSKYPIVLQPQGGAVTVGVPTATDPGPVKFTVRQSVGDTYALKITSNDATTSMLAVDKGGNVGINTATPGAKLDVVGDTAWKGASTVVGSMTVTGLFKPQNATAAAIHAISPSSAGGIIICTDCIRPYTICVSTGTGVDAFREQGEVTGCY